MNTPLPLFYRELAAFDTDVHGKLAPPKEMTDFRFAAETNVIPLLIHEMPLAIRHYPLVFLPGDDKNPPALAALVGVGDGKNRFVDAKGAWRKETYIPAWVRRYPFIAVNVEGQAEPLLALDPTADWLKKKGGEPLVKDGKPTARMEFILAYQREFQEFALRTQAAAKALLEAGLLEEGVLRFEQPAGKGGGQPREVRGFLIVSEAKLKGLAGEALAKLNAADALGLAYAQLLSLANLSNVMGVAGE